MSYVALGIVAALDLTVANAQEIKPGATNLPPVYVAPNAPRPRRAQATPSAASRTERARTPAQTAPERQPIVDSQDARSGTVGYTTQRTSSATKTNTPLLNVPQSVSVLTKQFIADQNFQNVSDAIRYVPGVIPHQGEGNRDQVVIRGQNSSADFYIDGFRDDVQYFRDLYNIQSIEVLKGPNALIFGRGGGGGVINRVLKDADGVPIREVTVQGGSFDNKRVSIDTGGAVSPDFAARINAVYEKSDSFRDFVHLKRYGINPTVAWLPNDSTKIKLSYEYFYDERTADRGIPSLGLPAATKFNPTVPFQTDPSTFFGNPDLSHAYIYAHIATATIEHAFDNGWNVKSASRSAYYDKYYLNVFPDNANIGSVNPVTLEFGLTGYNNALQRYNIFNQTDWTYKTNTGPILHTFLFGTDIGRQTSDTFRNNGVQFLTSLGPVAAPFSVSALNPTDFTPVVFNHLATDPNGYSTLNLAAAYAQDQIEITRYLQLIAGVRFDHFDLTFTNRNVNQTFNREDNFVSPRAGIVFKPVDNVSIYGSYSVSYLPSAGDQFGALTAGTAILEPEKFENMEVGAKWDIAPRLQFTTAIYNLDRFNQRLALGGDKFLLTGKTVTKGFETAVTGYVTDAWQMTGGYAYTDARIASDTSSTVTKGNRVGLVPYNTFTLWNRYQFNPVWGGGVGVIHYDDFFATSDDKVRLHGFTRVDAALYFRLNQNWRGQLNVENVFDTNYFSTADGNNNISPGSPRVFRVSATANF